MKLSFSTLACPDWSSAEVIRAATNYGYEGIEWRVVDGALLDSQFPIAVAHKLRDDVYSAGLEVCAVDTGIRLTLAPGPDRDAMLRETRGMLAIAAAMGAEHLRVFSGDYPDDVSVAEAVGWASASVAELVDDAEETGVKLAVELHNPMRLRATTAETMTASQFAMAVLDTIPSSAVGVQWDLGNPYLEGEKAAQTWERVQSRLLYCHTKDMAQAADGTLSYVPMGTGIIPLTDILTWLTGAGFGGWLSYEWEKKWHPELAEPEVALPQYIEFMRSRLS